MTKPNRFAQQPSGKFSHWGQGTQVTQIPEKIPITFSDFKGGYNSAPGIEDGPPDSSPNCQDVLVSHSNRLIRMAGGTKVLSLTDIISTTEMVVHESLQNVGELVLFAPPRLGILDADGLGTFDAGLVISPELFRWALYGETLIFTNGRGGVFKRNPGDTSVTPAPGIPLGRTYGVLSSRLFVGGAVIEGEYQPMGIAWNASDVDEDDFDGEGSGYEILLSDAAHGDAIVAVRMMNLDLMAILCKQSIWIGRRTQDPFRPAAFEPRIMGVGGLHDRACLVTPIGMTYLAETGLRTFDGNSSILISNQINNELLPLDFSKINSYRVNYDFKRNWIYLHTPACTWIYDIEYQRWYKIGIANIVDMAIWKNQVDGTTWDDLQSQGLTWIDLSNVAWSDLARRESGEGAPMFLQQDGAWSFLWSEDSTKQTWPLNNPLAGQDTTPQLPRWEFRHKEGKFDNTLVTIDAVIIKYAGGGDIRCYLPDNDGNPRLIFRQTLPASTSGTLRTVQINMVWSGKGASAMIELVSGDLEIAKFQMVADVRSSDPSRPGSDLQEYFGFWDKP